MKIQGRKQNRRDFFKKSLAGVAGISLLSKHPKGENHSSREANTMKENKIITRKLGQTDIQVPIIGLGATNQAVTRAALDAGVIYLDTAYYYGAGEHETMLGKVLKGRPRDSFVVATKIQGPMDYRTGLAPKKTSAEEFKSEFKRKTEISLKRLQLDYVDILFVHGVKNPGLIGFRPLKDALQELKREGKTRFIGPSFHQKEVSLIYTTVKEKIYDVILTSYNFRQPHKQEVKKAIAHAAQAGLGIVAMKAMAGVYWDKQRKYPINAKAALKWILQDENVHTTIPGINTFEQLELDLSVMADLTLTPQEKADLEFGEKQDMVGLYCAHCGRCRDQCRYHLDIPTIMRSYMYAYGYRNPAKAKGTLSEKNPNEITCRSCTTCKVSCTHGFDVPRKVQDIIRILEVPDDFLV
jgi:predicted aldo/keto reductase-like oxidoreductase